MEECRRAFRKKTRRGYEDTTDRNDEPRSAALSVPTGQQALLPAGHTRLALCHADRDDHAADHQDHGGQRHRRRAAGRAVLFGVRHRLRGRRRGAQGQPAPHRRGRGAPCGADGAVPLCEHAGDHTRGGDLRLPHPQPALCPHPAPALCLAHEEPDRRHHPALHQRRGHRAQFRHRSVHERDPHQHTAHTVPDVHDLDEL